MPSGSSSKYLPNLLCWAVASLQVTFVTIGAIVPFEMAFKIFGSLVEATVYVTQQGSMQKSNLSPTPEA
ncbi:MAG: hypothetical protein GVY07_04670 [Bacteroidetes bacterium]|nr:hypothetical protein [Bacteroidota bacterium]